MTCTTELCFTCKAAGLQACPFKGGALPLAPAPKVTVKVSPEALRRHADLMRAIADVFSIPADKLLRPRK